MARYWRREALREWLSSRRSLEQRSRGARQRRGWRPRLGRKRPWPRRVLGVTKGSFYWHFTDRAALLRAALARWEERATDSVIAWLATVDDPRERLVQLITRGSLSDRTSRIHVALGSAIAEPAVALALERVSRRRIGYLEECYAKLGSKPQAARRAALLAYASYLGLTRLRMEAPGELPE